MVRPTSRPLPGVEIVHYIGLVSKSPSRRTRETATGGVYRLGEEPSGDLSSTTTAEQRIEMVALLTRRAWELTGKPWPAIPRSEWPVRIIRGR